MAKYLMRLLLPLLLILGTNDALAQECYCVFPNKDGRCYANTTCWACAPGAYDQGWQKTFCYGYQAPVIQTCTPSSETRTESCGENQTGSKTYTRQNTCSTSGQTVQGQWTLTQDTCKWNPPTCQISTQTQTLSCPAGYTGSITQQQTSLCPNPYGNPVWSNAWVTTSNSCVKSISNPTNPTSPVSPISPMSQTKTATVQQTAPATASVVEATTSVVTAPPPPPAQETASDNHPIPPHSALA